VIVKAWAKLLVGDGSDAALLVREGRGVEVQSTEATWRRFLRGGCCVEELLTRRDKRADMLCSLVGYEVYGVLVLLLYEQWSKGRTR